MSEPLPEEENPFELQADGAPTAAYPGWFKDPAGTLGHVRYWKPSGWAEKSYPGNRNMNAPRDTPGLLSVILLVTGVVLLVVLNMPSVLLISLASLPVALWGLYKAKQRKHKNSLSMVMCLVYLLLGCGLLILFVLASVIFTGTRFG